MPDPKISISITDEDVAPSSKAANENLFDYYSQGSTAKGTDSQYIESPSIFLTDEDIVDIKGERQGYIDTISNNLATLGGKTAGNLLEGVGYLVGTVNGLAKAIDPSQDAKVSDFTENPIIEAGTAINEYIDKAFPNYDTTDETENPLALKNFMGTVMNSTVRDAAPFMAAAILEGYGIGKIFETPARAARLAKIAESGGEIASKASMFNKVIRNAPPEITQLLINNGEAMLEADHTSEQIYEDVFNRELIKNGGDEQLAHEVADLAKTEAFKNIWALNMAVLKINNLETRSLFKPALYSRRPLKELTKEWSTLTTKVDKAKFLAQKGYNMFSDPIKESAEELLQGGASQAVSDRILSQGADSRLSPDELFNSAANTLVEGVKRIGTDEGKIEALTSMILSGPVSIYHKRKAQEDERNNYLKRKGIYDSSLDEDITTDIKDNSETVRKALVEKGKELMSKARSFNETENLKNAAIVADDQTLYQIAKDTQLANLAFGHFEMGLAENLDSKINEITKEVGTELKANGKTTIEDFATGKNISIEQYSAQLKEKLRSYEDVYNSIEGQYNFPTPELRQAAFVNGVLQQELKRKIKNPNVVVGQSWLDYKSKFVDPKTADIDAIQVPAKELKELEGKTDVESITKSVELNNIIQSYKELKNFESEAPDLDAQLNYKNYRDNINNKLYYDALKQQFKTLVDPTTSVPYIESKVQEDEEKSSNIISPTVPVVENTKNPISTNSSNPGSATKEEPIMATEESESDVQALKEFLKASEAAKSTQEGDLELPAVFKNADIEGSVRNYKIPSADFDSKIVDDGEKPVKESIKETSVEDINNNITKKEREAKEIKNKIPLYITNRFEKQVGDKIPVDITTGETELENQEALKILLSLKQGDQVTARVGFYYPNKSKPDGDFLSYNEAKSKNKQVSPKTLTIRIYKDGVKLGAIKNNQEEDIQEIFNNIENNPNEDFKNNIINSNLEVSSKWSGFIRSLANKDLPVNYQDVPFEDRAYLNSPSQVTGSKDFVVITVTNEGDIKTPKKYTSKNYNYLGLKSSTDLIGKVGVTYLRPGVMYTLVKSPDGKIIPLQTNGEYITPENADYVISEITKAKKTKGYPLKELQQKISPFVYYDRTNGFNLDKGKIYYKGKEISLDEMSNIVKSSYKPINLDTITNKQLDGLLKLNVPKSTSIQFINPKITLNLSPLKSQEEVMDDSVEAESTLETVSTTNDIDYNYQQEIYNEYAGIIRPTTAEDVFEESMEKNLSDFDNVSDELVSKLTQDTSVHPTLNPENEIATAQDLKDLLKKYNKNIKDIKFNIKDLSNFTVAELEQHIKCL
jgi:hypothetical protein